MPTNLLEAIQSPYAWYLCKTLDEILTKDEKQCCDILSKPRSVDKDNTISPLTLVAQTNNSQACYYLLRAIARLKDTSRKEIFKENFKENIYYPWLAAQAIEHEIPLFQSLLGAAHECLSETRQSNQLWKNQESPYHMRIAGLLNTLKEQCDNDTIKEEIDYNINAHQEESTWIGPNLVGLGQLLDDEILAYNKQRQPNEFEEQADSLRCPLGNFRKGYHRFFQDPKFYDATQPLLDNDSHNHDSSLSH